MAAAAAVPSGDPELVTIEKFISVTGNYGKTGARVEVDFKEAVFSEDSDEEPCQGNVACMDSAVVGMRNRVFCSKYGVAVKQSQAEHGSPWNGPSSLTRTSQSAHASPPKV